MGGAAGQPADQSANPGAVSGLAQVLRVDSSSLRAEAGSAMRESPAKPSMVQKAEGALEKAEVAGAGVLSGFAHLLHMDSSPPAAEEPNSPASTEKAFSVRKEDFAPGPTEDAAPSKSAAKAGALATAATSEG